MLKIIRALLDLLFPESDVARELARLSTSELIHRCSQNRSVYVTPAVTAYTLFSYKDPLVKEMVWQIKFRKQRRYAATCGQLLYQRIMNSDVLHNGNTTQRSRSILLVPVPIHTIRRKERGFNQSEWLCEEIKKYDTQNIFQYERSIVERTTHTEKQSWNNRRTRFSNTQGIFTVVIPEKITGAHVIIIDDVVTTGATIGALTIEIQTHHPARISAFTIAH